MAVYGVRNIVQCQDQAEYDALQAHLAARGIVEGQPVPQPWDSVVYDAANLRITLSRRQQVDSRNWQ